MWHGVPQASLETTQSWAAELGVHSPACALCTLTPLQLGQSGDIALCPSWGQAQGILAQLCASSWGSVTHTWGSIGHLDIPHPQQTSLRGQRSHGCDIHDLPGDMQGTVCFPPFFIGVTGEKPSSVVVVFAFPWWSPCAVGGEGRIPGLGRWMCCDPHGF